MYQAPIQDARALRAVPTVGAPTTRTVRNVRYSDSHPWSRLAAHGMKVRRCSSWLEYALFFLTLSSSAYWR